MSETKTWLDDQAGREVFRSAVQPVLIGDLKAPLAPPPLPLGIAQPHRS